MARANEAREAHDVPGAGVDLQQGQGPLEQGAAVRRAEFTFADTQPVKGYSCYYVRVLQKDEEIAWSSPVWLGARPPAEGA